MLINSIKLNTGLPINPPHWVLYSALQLQYSHLWHGLLVVCMPTDTCMYAHVLCNMYMRV